MFRQTIKTNIIILFLLLLGSVSFSLLTSQYYFNVKLVSAGIAKTFELISNNISQSLENTSDNIQNILNANKHNSNLYNTIEFKSNKEVFHDLTQIMRMNQGIYAIYFAHKDGSFDEIINMNSSTILHDFYKAPKETRWLRITHINNVAQHSFYNEDDRLLSNIKKANNYNPLSRPWYTEATASKTTIQTAPYLFATLQKSGITNAIELGQEGTVFAIDYTLDELNYTLSLQKFEEKSEIFVFNQDGNKFATSKTVNSTKNHIEMIDETLAEALKNANDGKIIHYSEGEQEYFTMYKRLKDKSTFLGIKVNTQALIDPYIENIKYSLIIALLLLLIAIPLIFVATNIIIKPIRALKVENEKIKQRRFDDVKKIDTNIIDFIELSDSFVSMSHSIKEYQISQAKMLGSIVKLIAEAVDAKSAYTGGHCARVPVIAQLLIEKASESQEGIFKDFKLTTEDERREFAIGAWLHDCGKVTTPEYVVDKSTKLETINDRIHEVRTRFEVLWRDAQIEYLQSDDKDKAVKLLHARQKQLQDDFAFIAESNIGGEFMDKDKQARVREIANQEWSRNFDDRLGLGEIEKLRYDENSRQTLPATEKLLSDKKQHIVKREAFDYEAYKRDGFKAEVPENLYNYGEVYNLCIEKGTLTPEERYKINEHVILTIKMLEKIPFPQNMRRIPEYAGTHHETLIGTGYPRQLTKDELSIPSRIMAVADVFEALTASDRPYKKAKTLSASVEIMSSMVKEKHLDEDIFKLFLSSGLHKVYAKKYLKLEQIDDVELERYL